ncbi:hypothetical protein ZIOFF_064607 [Zingiber officinale]|uniref:Uncharacterized protein n=1 Tax=Zingiber officinale TaxID=94328 RepID=A0A8J5EY68_ZINOF|nr:hypothetical protein ZIOFF_064607 [Zingiber officinale]
MVVVGIGTWREEGERHRNGVIGFRRGGAEAGDATAAAEDGVVEVERRERLPEPLRPGDVGGRDLVDAETEVDASLQLV